MTFGAWWDVMESSSDFLNIFGSPRENGNFLKSYWLNCLKLEKHYLLPLGNSNGELKCNW